MPNVAHHFLKPVTRTTQTGDICREMVTHLIRGSWTPGDKIPPERELCVQLGVGRASLREALKALEIMGMIETRLGDGTYVCKRSDFFSRPLLWAIASSSKTEAHELIEARRLIEVELAGFAAERATAADLAKLGAYVDQMEGSLDDPENFLQADVAFHLSLGEAAHNTILMNALSLIRNLMQEWIGSALQSEGVAERALQEHKRIYQAVAKKKSSQARSAMDSHLKDMAGFFLSKQEANGKNRPVTTSRSRKMEASKPDTEAKAKG
jgi:GntR family transcriptional repressor for pyruvate dehydrogenase complex